MGRVPRGHCTGKAVSPAVGHRGRRWVLPSRRRSVAGGRFRLRAFALPSLAALLLLTACGGGDDRPAAADESDRRTTTTAPAETTSTLSPRQQEEQAVREAHAAAIRAREESAAAPAANPDLPAITETHTGLMLQEWQATTSGMRTAGWVDRFPPNTQHRVEIDSIRFDEVNGQQVAYLDVCAVNDSERVDLQTGEAVSGGVFTFQVTDAMQKVDGRWKLAERQERARWEGVAGCAVD